MIIYSYFSLAMGIIFALFAVFMLISTFTGWLTPRVACFIFCFILTLMSAGLISNSFDKPSPTVDDVMNGNAIYRETQIIQNSDTVRLYDIVWKEE